VNSEEEQVGDGIWGWDKEHDEWRMLQEFEAEEDAYVGVTEHEMLKV
jgi:hypothetical protein